MEPKQRQHLVVDVTGDGSKVQCCKEQYCRETWNVRSMNQGKLEVVKQEMVRVNVDIIGISDLKWTGMGEFNSDDIISTTVSRNHLKKWSSHHSQHESPKCSTWMQSQKHNMVSVRFQGKPFNIMVIQVYAPISNPKEAEVEQFCEDLQDLL